MRCFDPVPPRSTSGTGWRRSERSRRRSRGWALPTRRRFSISQAAMARSQECSGRAFRKRRSRRATPTGKRQSSAGTYSEPTRRRRPASCDQRPGMTSSGATRSKRFRLEKAREPRCLRWPPGWSPRAFSCSALSPTRRSIRGRASGARSLRSQASSSFRRLVRPGEPGRMSTYAGALPTDARVPGTSASVKAPVHGRERRLVPRARGRARGRCRALHRAWVRPPGSWMSAAGTDGSHTRSFAAALRARTSASTSRNPPFGGARATSALTGSSFATSTFPTSATTRPESNRDSRPRTRNG